MVTSRQRLAFSPPSRGLAADAFGTELPIGLAPGTPGARPADLLPLSLAACTTYGLVAILAKMRQDLRALEVDITSSQEDDPPYVFRAVSLHFVLHGAVDQDRAQRALRACPPFRGI